MDQELLRPADVLLLRALVAKGHLPLPPSASGSALPHPWFMVA